MNKSLPEDKERVVKDEEIDLLELLVVLWKDKKFIAFFTLTFTLLGLLLAVLMPRVYTSKSTIIPANRNFGDFGMLVSIYATFDIPVQIGFSDSDLKHFIESYKLHTKVIRELGLEKELRKSDKDRHEELLERFRKRVRVVQRGGVLYLSVEWNDPEKAKRINESILENLNALLKEKNTERIISYAPFYEERLKEIRKELLEKTSGLKELYKKSSVKPRYNSLSTEELFIPSDLDKEKLAKYLEIYLQIIDLVESQKRISLALDTIRMLASQNIEYIEVIEPPSYPIRPSKPKTALIVASGFIAGLMISVFVSLLKHSIKSRKISAGTG